MLTLKIKPSASDEVTPVSGIVNLAANGALTCLASPSNLVSISADRQLTRDDWYTTFLYKKQQAMISGGTFSGSNDWVSSEEDPVYLFENGLFASDGAYATPYLKTVQNTPPSTHGDFWILGGKTVDVSESAGSICVSLPAHHKQPEKCYLEYDWMLWRLYHCVCSLIGRLFVFAPFTLRDGWTKEGDTDSVRLRSSNNMGPYLGTYLQYQQLVALWNKYAWYSSFILEVQSVGTAATITIGYVNLQCKEYGPVKMTLTVNKEVYSKYKTGLMTRAEADAQAKEDGKDVEDYDYFDPALHPPWLDPEGCEEAFDPNTNQSLGRVRTFSTSPLTIYKCGIQSTLDENATKNSIEVRRLGVLTLGTGYEGRSPAPDGEGNRLDKDCNPGDYRCHINNCDYGVRIKLAPMDAVWTEVPCTDEEDEVLYYDETYTANGDILMKPEQRFCAAFSVAPCIGTDDELETQPVLKTGEVPVKNKLRITATWEIGGALGSESTSRVYSRSADVMIDAVSVIATCLATENG